jgi:hypothetical protein
VLSISASRPSCFRFIITRPSSEKHQAEGEASSKSHLLATIHHFLLFAFVKAFQVAARLGISAASSASRCAKIGAILLHNVERRFLGGIAMILGK